LLTWKLREKRTSEEPTRENEEREVGKKWVEAAPYLPSILG